MARQTSFAHQKQILEQFLSLLSDFDKNFKGLIEKHEEEIFSLYENEGLMEEIYQDYKSLYLDTMKETFYSLSSRITEEDIPFIEKEIDFISSR